MSISDIIRTDADRIFTVDPECIIIYTGDNPGDIKPFIRIGTWLNMPVELIPLVENIIITDLLVGNPAFEQFNIDIRELPSNRYIGSHTVARRFLEFQRMFGLDLTNAALVDAEKDIPEISGSKTISDRDSFIGIFYRDGNFLINHNKKELFNLRSWLDEGLVDTTTFQKLATLSRKADRYSNEGLAIAEGNPLFYRKNNIVSYLFPSRLNDCLSLLGINPQHFSAILHPSANFINLSRFLKWKSLTRGRINIFSDHDQEMTRAAGLFKDAGIKTKQFSSMNETLENGMVLQQLEGSYNVKVTYPAKGSGRKPLQVAWIKTARNIKEVINSRPDLLVISGSAYEDAVLQLKSCPVPLAIVDDGSRGITRLGVDRLVLEDCTQYDIDYCDDPGSIATMYDSWINCDLVLEALRRKETPIADNIASTENKALAELNLREYLRFLVQYSPEREIAGGARDALLKMPSTTSTPMKGSLILCNGTASLVWTLGSEKRPTCIVSADVIDDDDAANDDSCPVETAHLLRKIRDDRERLRRLLEMYYSQEPSRQELKDLRQAMESRRTTYEKDLLSADSVDGGTVAGLPASGLSGGGDGRKKEIRRPGGKVSGIALIALVLILVGGGIFGLTRLGCGEKKPAIEEILGLPDNLPAETGDLYRIKYGMSIDGRAIFDYANEIAVVNGYSAFPYADFQKKNPHWIFPGSSFKLPGNGEVSVKKGNTLWSIAEVELRRREMTFYYALDRCEQILLKEGSLPPEALQYLESKAATPAHTQALEAFRARITNNAGR